MCLGHYSVALDGSYTTTHILVAGESCVTVSISVSNTMSAEFMQVAQDLPWQSVRQACPAPKNAHLCLKKNTTMAKFQPQFFRFCMTNSKPISFQF